MIFQVRQKTDFSKRMISFGAYNFLYIVTIKTMKPGSVTVIALRSSNDYGGCYFVSLFNYQRLNSNIW